MATMRSSSATATRSRRTPFFIELYRSALGKKYVMAVTGIVGLGYIFAHMVGNLKLYQGPEALDEYAKFLKNLLYPIVPQSAILNILRSVLILALIFHVLAAVQLTRMNRLARPTRYKTRDYVAANFASRTMRWTGVLVLLFLVYHLADFTWGTVNTAPAGATLREKVIASFSTPAIAGFYITANLALGVHLFHGVWSLFQSMGWNNRRFNHWRRGLAIGFTAVVIGGNLSFPIAVLTGIIS
jgi:succinate dehydrogenase / fumarate reductase cytochrome b subunit